MYSPELLMMDGKTDVESYAKINNLRNWCIWLVLLQEYITCTDI
jgi:hypothetical protein